MPVWNTLPTWLWTAQLWDRRLGLGKVPRPMHLHSSQNEPEEKAAGSDLSGFWALSAVVFPRANSNLVPESRDDPTVFTGLAVRQLEPEYCAL